MCQSDQTRPSPASSQTQRSGERGKKCVQSEGGSAALSTGKTRSAWCCSIAATAFFAVTAVCLRAATHPVVAWPGSDGQRPAGERRIVGSSQAPCQQARCGQRAIDRALPASNRWSRGHRDPLPASNRWSRIHHRCLPARSGGSGRGSGLPPFRAPGSRLSGLRSPAFPGSGPRPFRAPAFPGSLHVHVHVLLYPEPPDE